MEEEPKYGIEINATKGQIKRFKSSILWQDISRELNLWLEGFRVESSSIVDNAAINNPSTASVLLHLGDLNGREKAVRYLLGILDVFLNTLENEDAS